MKKLILGALLLIVLALPAHAGTANAILCPNAGQTGNSANCVQPPVLTFGDQGTSTTSAQITVTVNNCAPVKINGLNQNPNCTTGSGTLTLGATYSSISGTNAADFSNTGLGTCANNGTVASGAFCTIVLTFTPSQTSGTNETATLTVTDNGTTPSQTMSLTGTSATVTAVGSCTTFSGGHNYQLTANLSATQSCLTGSGSNIDVNLNGFTITYCTSSSASLVGGVLMTGNTTNLTVHNGTIQQGAGACTGLTAAQGFGSSDIGANSQNTITQGTQIFNLTLSQSASQGKIFWEENAGVINTSRATIVHDVSYTDNDAGDCSTVGCRAEDEFYPIISDQSFNRSATGTQDQFYNIFATGGPQGAISDTAPTIFENNLLNPGTSVTNGTVANGFGTQLWGPNSTSQNNIFLGTGLFGGTLSTRGIQVSSAANRAVTGDVIQGNSGIVNILDNDAEYSCSAGSEIGSAYGIQINTAGSGRDLSNNLIENNNLEVVADHCGGYAFAWSGATIGSGVNTSENNQYVCVAGPDYTYSLVRNCAAIRLDANQYNPGVAAVVNHNDYFSGVSADVYLWYDGSPQWTCSQCTFNKPTGAVSQFLFLDYDGAQSTGCASTPSQPFFFVDPTFTGGATESSNNLSGWAANNNTCSFGYTIEYTQTIHVQNSSLAPVSGASVVYTDALSNTYPCTTDASGNCSVVVNENQYSASGGTTTTTHYNNYARAVSAVGYTTNNASGLNVTSPNSVTVTLGGGSTVTAPGNPLITQLRKNDTNKQCYNQTEGENQCQCESTNVNPAFTSSSLITPCPPLPKRALALSAANPPN